MNTVIKRFTNIPESALKSINVVMTTRLESDYDNSILDIERDYNYYWVFVDDNIYDLYVNYEAIAYLYINDYYYDIPIYVTIELFFKNKDQHFITQSEGQ